MFGGNGINIQHLELNHGNGNSFTFNFQTQTQTQQQQHSHSQIHLHNTQGNVFHTTMTQEQRKNKPPNIHIHQP